MRKSLLLLPLFVMLASCNSLIVQSKHYSYAQPTYAQAQIVEKGSDILKDAVLLGTVSVDGDFWTPTKKCTYVSCLEAVTEEAKKMGGKYIELITVREPGRESGTTCYSMVANIYTDKQ